MCLFTAGLIWFNTVTISPWPGVALVGVAGAVISSVLWGVVPVVSCSPDIVCCQNVMVALKLKCDVTTGCHRSQRSWYCVWSYPQCRKRCDISDGRLSGRSA